LMVIGTIRLDELDLISRKADTSLLLPTEIRTVRTLRVFKKRRLTPYDVAASNHNILADQGRRATHIIIEGDFVGKDAKDSIMSLRSKCKSGNPVNFSSDIVSLNLISQVILKEILVENVSYLPLCFSYLIHVVEYLSPQQSAADSIELPSPKDFAANEFEQQVKREEEFLLKRGQ